MKFLTDTQARAQFTQQLKGLGWEVATVYEHGIEREKDDAQLVAWAHTFGYVFITFDKLRNQTGVRVSEQIRLRRGKVIVIGGGSDQPVERTLGKLLFHYEAWFPLLSKGDGKFRISDTRQSWEWTSREQLQQAYIRSNKSQLDEYLAKRRAAGQPIRRPRRKVSLEQAHMHLTQGA